MRLFVALDLPTDVKDAIGKEQRRLAPSLGSLRLVKPDQMHVTLVFLGDVAEDRAALVVHAVDAGVDMAPFDVVFGGSGVFPPRGAPRALWIGMPEGAQRVIALQEILARRIAALGIALENRPYRPHLTIARWRESRSSDRRTVEAAGTPARLASAMVDHATLYQSRLSSAGPQYTALARARLSGTGL